MLPGPTRAAAPKAAVYDWKDVAVGAAAAGSHSWDKGTFTVTGTGGGLNVKGADDFQGLMLTQSTGDFEMVARVTAFNGAGKDSSFGIMARADLTPSSNMTAFYYRPENNSLNWMTRVPALSAGGQPRVMTGTIQLAREQAGGDAAATGNVRWPLWIRLMRIGKCFAVYKSRDGKFWSMISNVSGGTMAIDGPCKLGFFVTGTDADSKPATATFDMVRSGPANMGYKTSWVGNSLGARDFDGHVSNSLSAMWVAPDGTCYTSSGWDEAGCPVAAYKDGKSLGGIPVGSPQSSVGGITGDDKNVYVVTGERIMVVDPAALQNMPRSLPLSVHLVDKKTNYSAVSGLASTGKELFVADSRDNLIRVATLEPIKTYYRVRGPNDGVVLASQPVAAPDDPRAAPAIVYQSQRIGEGDTYDVTDLKPGAAYTVRCHFVEYFDKTPAARQIERVYIDKTTTELNITELAGGKFKAYIKDIPDVKADADGKIMVTFQGAPFTLCALEVLGPNGERAFAVNCGGPPVGDFKGESLEMVPRAFPFERPGPMAVDKRGDLWIIQRGEDFPIGAGMTAKYKAAIKCYKTDGTFTGRQITDVVNPRALGYDRQKDQLLVGENSSDLNVRIYSGLASKPALLKTFGQKGGIYSGTKPGLVYDPAAGGYARFAGISGVGVDAKGNLYVGGGYQGTDLRQFTPDGKPGWMLNSLMFCNTYDFDPASDGTEIYGTYNHVKLDLTKTGAGQEQKYVAYNWDMRNYGEAVGAGGSQSIVRRVGPKKQLVMYTSGQGLVGDIRFFRYEGELAIPAGAVRTYDVWIDANGDGKEQSEETTKMASPLGWVTSVAVDSKGDIWAGVPTTGGSFMRHFTFKGCTAKGVPQYSGVKSEGYEDIPFPEEGTKTSGWSMSCRLDYDADRDIMIAFFPAVARKGEADKTPAQYFLGRYDNWSKGNRTSTWKVKVFTPYTDPDYFMYEVGLYPYSGYMGMKLAGDYVFMAYLFGEVHAFDLKTGQLAQTFPIGPELNGQSAWEDAAMGLRATKTKAGEYLIFTENSGWGGKNNFFRWKP